MNEITGKARTINELLKDKKYSIDYYQREYKWQTKQVRELMEDLTGKFLEAFEVGHPRNKVANYPHYFLGSIIVSKKENASYIVDGQQRLTTLTLLLILLRNLQKGRTDQVNIDALIFSEQYGEKSFNIQVDERTQCMKALFDELPFDVNNHSESVRNLNQRYHDLAEIVPEEIQGRKKTQEQKEVPGLALPYFIDWLLHNVHFVEITAYSDDDAYTIFETMNDRGLSLSPTDMLKGYLLANIDENDRNQANDLWRKRVEELNNLGKDVEADFFKVWLRSQYANSIRERKKNAVPKDFDRIGTEFHRWLRDKSSMVGLKHSNDYLAFIQHNLVFFSKQYMRLMQASQEVVPGLEHVLYNAQNGFTLQYMVLFAPLTPNDSETEILKKLHLTAKFIDITLTRRIWNFRSIAYSTMQYAMFRIMQDIRHLPVLQLRQKLFDILNREQDDVDFNNGFYMHRQNRYLIHRILARITDYIETQSGLPSLFSDYINLGAVRYEVEHIWANHYDQHVDEFRQSQDFAEYRNHIGDLLLLPKKFNASYGDLTYTKKLPQYNSQNLLARSLNPQCYEHNPGFLKFVQQSGLPFKAHPQFKKADIDDRGNLYCRIAEHIWNPDDLLTESAL